MTAVKIGDYTFDGPYASMDRIEDRSGVYAVLCRKEDGYYLIDIGESAQVKTRLDTHDRKDCWKRNCQGTLTYAVYYTPHLQQPGRMEIEQKLRAQYRPPCGEK